MNNCPPRPTNEKLLEVAGVFGSVMMDEMIDEGFDIDLSPGRAETAICGRFDSMDIPATLRPGFRDAVLRGARGRLHEAVEQRKFNVRCDFAYRLVRFLSKESCPLNTGHWIPKVEHYGQSTAVVCGPDVWTIGVQKDGRAFCSTATEMLEITDLPRRSHRAEGMPEVD
jgi:hypothetical protein